MHLERHNADLDIPNENIVIYKDIDDLLDDLNLSPADRELYKDVIITLEQTMYDGFQQELCVSIPYVGRIMKNIGKRNLQKNRHYLRGVDKKEQGKLIDDFYNGPFRLALLKRKEKRQAIAEQKLEEKRNKAMRKNNKFKFNIGIETKAKVTEYHFRKNYVKPGTFRFVSNNGKNNSRKNINH